MNTVTGQFTIEVSFDIDFDLGDVFEYDFYMDMLVVTHNEGDEEVEYKPVDQEHCYHDWQYTP